MAGLGVKAASGNGAAFFIERGLADLTIKGLDMGLVSGGWKAVIVD
jgi:hypothetical protein